MVAPVKQIVGHEDDAACANRRCLESFDERPTRVGDSVAHANVVICIAAGDVGVSVSRIWPTDRRTFHACQLIVKIEMICAGKIVVVFFVVEGPVM